MWDAHTGRGDGRIGFLLAVSLVPFSTAWLAGFITFHLALVIYWLSILLLGVVLYGSWRYAVGAKLIKDEITAEMRSAVERRIAVAQALYKGRAVLCIFNTYLSIAVIVPVRLNYVIAPRIPTLYRL